MSGPARAFIRRGPRAVPLALLLACAAAPGAGCDVREAGPAAAPPPDAAPAEPRRRAWHEVEGSEQVALPADRGDPELEGAMARARQTAPDARRRWAAAGPADRAGWAVKWAAPTVEGGIEYVWVEPLAWSAFRIEGRLASPPSVALACGRGRDDFVGFPAEELADWVHAPPALPGTPAPAPARAGGFTIDVLERRYGAAEGGV